MAIPILLWKKQTCFLFFVLIFALNAISSIRYTIVNIQDYYIPSFILIAILIGFGLSFIALLTPKLLKPASVLFLLFLLIPYHTNYFQSNRTKFYFAYDCGMNILKPLKEDAIIFSYGDADTFSLYYFLYAEGRRKDVSVLCWTFLPCDWHIEPIKRLHPEILFPFNKMAIKAITEMRNYDLQDVKRKRFAKIVSENLIKFPIYIGSGTKEEGEIGKNYLLLPEGLFFRLFEKETNRDKLIIELEKKPQFFLRGLNDKTIFKDRVASGIIENYSLSYNERGNLWKGIDVGRAITEYKNALALNPSYPSSQFNLGFAYIDKKDYDKAMEVFRKMAKENPNYNPSLLHYGIGLVYQNKGIIDRAIKEYELALKISPNNIYAKESLQEIFLLTKD